MKKAKEAAYQRGVRNGNPADKFCIENGIHPRWSKIIAQFGEAERKAGYSEGRLDGVKSITNHIQSVTNARQAALEEGIKAVEAEEELDGPIPQSVVEKVIQDPETCLRFLVITTKRHIADRIRQLKGK